MSAPAGRNRQERRKQRAHARQLTDQSRSRRGKGQRSSKPQKKAEPEAFDRELGMLARGYHLPSVLESAHGLCSRGRAQTAAWLLKLEKVPTVELRRMLVQHYLRTFVRVVPHSTGYRAIDHAAYVGRKHLAAQYFEKVDAETGEVTQEVWQPHCPARMAGGISRRMTDSKGKHRSPRTCDSYRKWMRDHGLIGSEQPPHDGEGARVPKKERLRGKPFAYAQHWLTHAPSPEQFRRWGLEQAAQAAELEIEREEREQGTRRAPRLDPRQPEALRDLLEQTRGDAQNPS